MVDMSAHQVFEGRAFAARRLVLVLFAAVMACVVLLFATGCGNSAEKSREAIEQSVRATLDELTALTSDSDTQLFTSDYAQELVAAGVDPATVYGPLFSRMTYSIDGVTVDGDQAEVELTVTNVDLTTAMQNYTAVLTGELSTKAGRDALAALDTAAATKHFAEVLVECLESDELGTTTQTVALSFQRTDGVWTLQNGSDLGSALLGGLDATSAATPSEAQVDAAAATAEANVAEVTAETQAATDAQAAADAAAAAEAASAETYVDETAYDETAYEGDYAQEEWVDESAYEYSEGESGGEGW